AGSDVALFLLSTCAIDSSLARREGVYAGRAATLTVMVELSLVRLAGLVSRRRRTVFATWLALLAAGGWFSLHQNEFLSGGGWEGPGSPSLQVANTIQRAYPGATTPAFTVFVQGGNVGRRVAEVRQIVGRLPQVRAGAPLFRQGAALVPVSYSGKTSNAIDEATTLRHRLVDPTTKVIGEPAIWSNFQTVSKHQRARGEEVGFPLILLILLAGFGTVVAAVAPMALGFAAVFLSGAVIYGLSRAFEISVYVTNMASMVGIGVAVDYSLFIVSRFRRELHEGATREEALSRALRSSGTAVVFSGAAVVVSLGALFAIDVNALRSMAVGAIVVVGIAMLASITLLPAMLASIGTHIDRFRLPLPWRTSESGSDVFWSGWARRVMRRPVAGLALGAGVMLVLAIPFLWMQTFNRGLDELPPSAQVRVAAEQAQRRVGPGFGAPVHVLTTNPAVATRIASIPGVRHVTQPIRSADGTQWLVDATLSVPVESSAARTIVDRIQAAAPDATLGGSTVFDRDVTNAIFGGLWKMLFVVLAACYVVLLVLLRSVVLPLKAVLMNLLSVGAAYGVL